MLSINLTILLKINKGFSIAPHLTGNCFYLHLYLNCLKMDNSVIFTQFSMLPDNFKQEAADFIAFLSQKNKPKIKKERKFGAAKGMFVMSPDFDDPLEDFKEYL